MKKFSLKISIILVVTLSMLGCDSQKPSNPSYASTTASMMVIPMLPNTVWDQMASDFSFKSYQSNPRVQKFIKQYSREKYYHLTRLSEQATPYLYHVVRLLEERGLPPELALLPIIESEYRPTAASNRGAVGLWQLVSMTGKLYGLKQDQWYDGRKDVNAATIAALDHLEFLYNKFDQDWLLALAAYNAGGGRVASAIRANKKAGKPTDYWSLNLPQQTQLYVPKFLSLVYLVKNYKGLNINLAQIPNKPYFDTIKLNKQINLEHAAKLAEVDLKEVKKLNAAYRSTTTHPKGPHDLVLPVQNISTFKSNFNKHANQAKAAPKPAAATAKAPAKTTAKAAPKTSTTAKVTTPAKVKASAAVHVVHKGDTLNIIASKYRTTVKAIKIKNNLTSDIIRSGQKLAV